MDLTVTYKNLEQTPSIREKIEDKVKKFNSFFDGKLSVHWTCGIQDKMHFSEIDVVVPGQRLHAKGEADNLYKTFDIASQKIKRQLQKIKEIQGDHIHHKHDPVPSNTIE